MQLPGIDRDPVAAYERLIPNEAATLQSVIGEVRKIAHTSRDVEVGPDGKPTSEWLDAHIELGMRKPIAIAIEKGLVTVSSSANADNVDREGMPKVSDPEIVIDMVKSDQGRLKHLMDVCAEISAAESEAGKQRFTYGIDTETYSQNPSLVIRIAAQPEDTLQQVSDRFTAVLSI